MIKEVIVVEGKQDIQAVRRAVEAEIVATGGFSLPAHTLNYLQQAYHKRGLIILTDPDSAGERIRRFLTKRFPDAKHAFVPREQATANDDIGIEQASSVAIQDALSKVRTQEISPRQEFSQQDMIAANLTGTPAAAARRALMGAKLGIGFANAKTFLQRLNNYGVTRNEWNQALAEVEAAQ